MGPSFSSAPMILAVRLHDSDAPSLQTEQGCGLPIEPQKEKGLVGWMEQVSCTP